MDKQQLFTLISSAKEARKSSYSPYSEYCVGAALLASSGEIVTGCNIENAAYGPTICAERTAIFKAISEGVRSFEAIAIAGSPKGDLITQFAYPCGVCRQVMMEFCDPDTFIIICVGPDDSYQTFTLKELLPLGFGPDNLSAC